jgi:hypothetical protein
VEQRCYEHPCAQRVRRGRPCSHAFGREEQHRRSGVLLWAARF